MNRRYRNHRHRPHRSPTDHRSLRLQELARSVSNADRELTEFPSNASLAIVEYTGKVIALEAAWDDLLEALAA